MVKKRKITSIRLPSERSFSQGIPISNPPIPYEPFNSQPQSSEPCALCRSTKWRMNEIGYLVCENGHQNQLFRTEEQDDFSGGTGRRMRQAFSQESIPSSSQQVQSQKMMELSQIEEGRNPSNIIRNGDEDRFDLALALQHIFKDQIKSFCKYLSIDSQEKESFEERAKGIWLLYINLQKWHYSEGEYNVISDEDHHPLPLGVMEDIPPFGPSILLAILLLSSNKYPVCGEDLRRAVMQGFIRFDTVKLPDHLMSWLKVRKWDIYFKGKSYSVPSVGKIEALTFRLALLIGYSPSLDSSLFLDLWSEQLKIPSEISKFVKKYFKDKYCWKPPICNENLSPIQRLMVNFLMGIWICCRGGKLGIRGLGFKNLKERDEDFDFIFEKSLHISFKLNGKKMKDYLEFCDKTLNLRNKKIEGGIESSKKMGRLERLEFYYPIEGNGFIDVPLISSNIIISNNFKYDEGFHYLLEKMSAIIGRDPTLIRELLLKRHRRIIRN